MKSADIVIIGGGAAGLMAAIWAARTAQDKTALQRQIDATDREIDRLVYELYGLTEQERGIVEGDRRG